MFLEEKGTHKRFCVASDIAVGKAGSSGFAGEELNLF